MNEEEKAKMADLERFILFVATAGWGKEARNGIDRAAKAMAQKYNLGSEASK